MSVAVADGQDDIYECLEKYGWDDDAEFQSGLSAILGSTSSPEQASELTLRARCFYYTRKYNVNVDFDAYKAYRSARGRPPPVSSATSATSTPPTTAIAGGILPEVKASSNEPPVPYPTSFAHIVELVTTGQPIPGIKDIPDTILEGQASQATRSKRRKPWEKDELAPSETLPEGAATAT